MKSINIRTGDFRQRIRIQYKATTKDPEGFPIETWQDLGAAEPGQEIWYWAKWQWLHGNEFWQAQAVQSKAVAEVTIRYMEGVAPDMQVLYKDKVYKIIPPIDNILERNRYIVFKVEIVESR